MGNERQEIGAELSGNLGAVLSFDVGVEQLTEVTGGVSNDRTDLALRLAYQSQENVEIYAFGQATLASNGLDENNRYGVGVNAEFDNGWTLGAEVSDGSGGLGARVLASHSKDENGSTYFDYELDAGRALNAGISPNDNGGKYLLAANHQINEDVNVFGEATYDIFGNTRELINAYGVTYAPTDIVPYTATLDAGRLTDPTNGDIDRRALSFGVKY